MLAAWTVILPLFVVRWLALRYCQRLPFEGLIVVQALPDVFIRVPPRKSPHGRCHEHRDEDLRIYAIAEGQEFLRCYLCHPLCHPARAKEPQESFPGEHPF